MVRPDPTPISIQRLLIHLNIAAERLLAIGSSDTVPIAGNATEEGRTTNRHV